MKEMLLLSSFYKRGDGDWKLSNFSEVTEGERPPESVFFTDYMHLASWNEH
jgi:hypothetical protein